MNYLQCQQDLHDNIGDETPKWLPDTDDSGTNGKALKSAVLYGIKQVYDRLEQNALYKEQYHIKVELASDLIVPTDLMFLNAVIVDDVEYTDYRFDKKNRKIDLLGLTAKKVEIEYIEKENVLTLGADKLKLDEHFRFAIALYGEEKYHLAQFDRANAAQSVAYAEDKMEDLINKYF